MAMEFWGVEAKGNVPCKVVVEPGSIIHLSQATLGGTKKDNETVLVHVTVGKQKLVLAMLSQKTPQLSLDLVFDEDFEISHNWSNGNIHLMGYQSQTGEDYGSESDSSDEEEEDVPVARENGLAAPVAKAPAVKPSLDKTPKAEESDDSDEDDSDEDDDSEDVESADEQMTADGETDSGDEDDSDESEEETPVKVAESGKKRAKADLKTPQSKKAKIATPQKTDGKKGVVHPATPHPNKKGGKTPGGEKTPKSVGSASDASCGPCKKRFKSESALQSHAKAKHGAK